MDALLVSPSPEPQNPIIDPANSMVNHQSEKLRHELKDEMIKQKIKPSTLLKRKLKAKKKETMNSDEAPSSCSSSSTFNPNSTRRVSRVAHRLRNPTVRLGMARRSVGERQARALALPLGMSFAAVVNLVLERGGQNVYVDDLAVISASAVKESLANVYGDKLDSFATNFKRSFKSTLRILKLTNEYTFPQQLNNNNVASSTIDECSDTELSAMETSSATSSPYEEIQGGARTTSSMNEIVLHEEARQLYALPRSSEMSLTIFEGRYLEQLERANDIETMKMCLKMRELSLKETGVAQKSESNNMKKAKLSLKETEVAQMSESNNLEKAKLSLKETEVAQMSESNNLEKAKQEKAASEAAFRDEKFKTELECTRRHDFVMRTKDWLGVSLFIMVAFMIYGASVFSQHKIKEATSICVPSKEESSLWWGFSRLNTEFNILICRIGVWAKYFGVFMILFLTYLIINRSSGTRPVTFIVIFLGIVCGLAGKFCVDTLGGNGDLWLWLWEVFCGLQFVAHVFTMAVYGFIYGPITVTQDNNNNNNNTWVPYWARRCCFFGVIRFVLPAITGLLAFATFGEWRDHFFGGSKV